MEKVELKQGDWLAIFSDGIPETPNENGEEFGRERLIQIVVRNHQRGAAEMCDAILAEITSHSCGRPSDDDLTLIVARAL